MLFRSDSARKESRKSVTTAIDSLDQKLEHLEERLFQRRTTGRGQDDVRWSPNLAEQLEYLAGSVGGSDYPPTASQRDVARLLHDRATSLRSEFNALTSREIPAMNALLRQAGLDGVGG